MNSSRSGTCRTVDREASMNRFLVCGTAILVSIATWMLTSALAQADFYRGKTVSVVIGAKTGSLAVAAQIVSRHIGRHIPGNPTVVFRQMPGGAHLGATGQVYNVLDADGLTILAANSNVA